MIEFLQQPDLLHLSHQKSIIKARTNNHVVAGAATSRTLKFYELIAGNPVMSYPEGIPLSGTCYATIMDQDFELLFPNASDIYPPIQYPGYQFYAFRDGKIEWNTWKEVFQNALLLNPELNSKYFITIDNYTPSAFNVSFISKQFIGPITPIEVDAYNDSNEEWDMIFFYLREIADSNDGAQIEYDDTLRISLEILDETETPIANPFWRMPLIIDDTNINGLSEWDISSILEAQLRDKPMNFSTEYLSGSPWVRHRNFFKYKIRITTLKQDLSTQTITSSWKYCLYGKPSWYQQALWNETGGSFYNDILTHNKFLTQQPQYKKTGWNGPEWLYFINPYPNSLCTIKVKSTFYDSTTIEKDLGTFEAFPYDTYQIDVSPMALELSGKPVFYEVYVQMIVQTSGIEHQTETRTFEIDYKVYANARTFIFQNHYGGGFDTIRATGMLKATGNLKKETKKIELPDNYTFRDFEFVNIDSEFITEFELNWGFLQQYGKNVQDWVQYMRQVEMSPFAFEYMDGLILPCLFKTEKWEMWDDETALPEHISTFERAYVDKGHSNDPIILAPDYNDDFNEDYLS